MTYKALGLVEVLGSSNAILAVDQMLKTAAVEFCTWNTKYGGHVTVFISGDISAVNAAVDRINENPPCRIIVSAVISNPSEETAAQVEREKQNYLKTNKTE